METKRNIMDLHSKLIRMGEYRAARQIFRLLMHGAVVLGYSATDLQVQFLLEDMGVPVISVNGVLARARIA